MWTVAAGFATAYADPQWPEKKGFVEGPGVVLEHRRKGVGTALLQTLIDDLKQRGMTQAELTGDDCAATNAFCARHGFKVSRSHSTMRRSLENLPSGPGETNEAVLGLVEPTEENLATFLGIQYEASKGRYNYRPWTMDGMKAMVADQAERGSPNYFMFARVDGKPVGYLWYGYNPKRMAQLGRKGAFIFDLAVLKEYRHRGIAKALVLAGLEHVRAEGRQEARLWVDDVNATGARKLYERLGFSTSQRDLSYLKDL